MQVLNLLAFDTATPACTVALKMGDQLFSRHEMAPAMQASMLLPIIETLLQEANTDLNALDAIAVGAGPGSFMGVRLALSTAQGLAFGKQIPVIPVSTLQILAQTVVTPAVKPATTILAGWDARMGEIYWGIYRVDATGIAQPLSGDQLSLPQNILLSESIDSMVGNAWMVYREQLPSAVTAPIKYVEHTPTATALIDLAISQFLTVGGVSAAALKPAYIRQAVV